MRVSRPGLLTAEKNILLTQYRSPVIMGLACLRSDLDNQRLVNSSEEDNLNGLSESLGLLEDIEMSANSAVEVLNEVLQYDKVERSALKLELSMVDIFDTVEKVRGCNRFF